MTPELLSSAQQLREQDRVQFSKSQPGLHLKTTPLVPICLHLLHFNFTKYFHKVLFYDNLLGIYSNHCPERKKNIYHICLQIHRLCALAYYLNCSQQNGRIKTKVHYLSESLNCNIQIWNSSRKKTNLMLCQPMTTFARMFTLFSSPENNPLTQTTTRGD